MKQKLTINKILAPKSCVSGGIFSDPQKRETETLEKFDCLLIIIQIKMEGVQIDESKREEVEEDLLNQKLDMIYEALQEIIQRLPPSPSSSSTFLTPKWWQILPLHHPLSQTIELALMNIKAKIADPEELRKLLYNPYRGSLPSNKKKCQTTAHSPLIPFLLHRAGFPILLTGYTDECSQIMYEEAVSTLRTMWKKQRKRYFPGLPPRTGGAGATCHEIDCQWFQKHYGGLEKVNFSQIMGLILNRTLPALQEPPSSNDPN